MIKRLTNENEIERLPLKAPQIKSCETFSLVHNILDKSICNHFEIILIKMKNS